MSETPKSGQQQDLANALASIINILLGEKFETINASLKTLESNVKKQVDDVQHETGRRLEALEKDTAKKIEELSRSLDSFGKVQEDGRSKMERSVNQTVTDLRGQVAKTEESLRGAMVQIRSAMEKELLAQQERIYTQFSAIEEHLQIHQNELLQRGRETRRISALMSNFAKVLTEVEREEPGAAKERQASAAHAAAKEPKSQPKEPQSPQARKTETSSADMENEELLMAAEEQLPTSEDIDQSMDDIFKVGKKK
jgi:hypothetical protein